MVLSAKLRTDALKRKLGHFLDNIRCNYSCGGYLGRSLHAPDIIGGNAIYCRHVAYDPVNGNGGGGIIAEYLPDSVLRLCHGGWSAHKVLICFQLLDAALQLPDVGLKPCGDAIHHIVGKLEIQQVGFSFYDSNSRFKVGSCDIRNKAPFKSCSDTLFKGLYILWWAVGGEDYLLALGMKLVEGMEKFLLS